MGRIAKDTGKKAKKSRNEQRKQKEDEGLTARSVDFFRSDDDDDINATQHTDNETEIIDIDASSTSKAQMASAMDCTNEPRLHNTERNFTSPWKFHALHTGTKRDHYHLIDISTAKNWGHNTKLGKNIRSHQYKCSAIACVQCLLQYITTGTDRKTFRNILRRCDVEVAKCVSRQLGIISLTSSQEIQVDLDVSCNNNLLMQVHLPKGEIIYFKNKGAHEPTLSQD